MKKDLLQTVRRYCKMLFDVDLENKNPANAGYDCILGGGGSFKNLILSGFRPVEKFKKLFNPAFTLAEVLITLGIIGVVAAMTIPTLMTKVKEKQTVTKVKKAYSTLANAYKLMENDDEVPLSGCIEGGNAKVCLTTLSKYIKSAKIVECGSGDSEWFDEKNVPTVSWMSITANNTQILQTMDGMIFYFVCYPLSEIIVDVNGQAGPNAGGKDAFAFYYNQYDNNGKKQLTYKLRPASGICTKTNYGDWCTAQLLQTGNMDYLTKTAKELGFTDPNDSSSSFIGNSLDDSSTSFICNMTSSNSFISNY